MPEEKLYYRQKLEEARVLFSESMLTEVTAKRLKDAIHNLPDESFKLLFNDILGYGYVTKGMASMMVDFADLATIGNQFNIIRKRIGSSLAIAAAAIDDSVSADIVTNLVPNPPILLSDTKYILATNYLDAIILLSKVL